MTWSLSASQRRFFESDAFASLYIGGWGSGKTWIGARKAFRYAWDYPDSLGLIAANTIKQLHQSTLVEFWKALREDFLLEYGRDYVFNERPPRHWAMPGRFAEHASVISFRWGAQVLARSLTNHETILGLNLGWAWIDEARDAKREAFDSVLSRLRCNRIPKPRVDITTTPNGFDWLYEYFEAQPGEHPELRAQRSCFSASTLDNRENLPETFLASLLSSIDENMALQNIHGQWVDVTRGRAYYMFRRQLHLSDLVTFNSCLQVYLCCDFNATPMSWVVAQPGRKDGRPTLLVVDEIVIRDSSTPEAVEEFFGRGYGAMPHQVEVFGDASGHQTTVGQSDYAILRQRGLTNIHARRQNPPVIDRVNAVNALLSKTGGETGILIHPRCRELIRDFSQVGFKPGTRILDKSDPDRTHASDALGYCIVEKWPVHRGKVIRTRGTRL